MELFIAKILIFLRFFLYFLGFLLITCTQKKEKKISEQQIQYIENKQIILKKTKLDLIFQELVKEKNFNGAFFWREKDKIILEQSYGFAKKNIPLNLTHSYYLGTLTETFTALGIFYLEKKGLLHREDSVLKFINQFPYPQLKIQNLLQHTSGLPDFKNIFLKENNTLLTYATNRNVIDWVVVSKPTLLHLPNEKISHSNTNYVILARIIELVTQQNFSNFLEKTFFRPLNMSQANTLAYKQNNEHLLRGQDFKKNIFLDDSPFMYVQGSEGVCASALDLQKWDNAMHNPKGLFYELSQNLHQTPSISNPSQASGWATNGNFFFKQGNSMGYKTAFYYFPNEKRTFILLSNNNPDKFNEILKMIYSIINE